MDIGVAGFTERELIRSVIMQRIPPGWRSSLLRSGNNNVRTIEDMISYLIPIETADSEEQKRRARRNNDGDNRRRNNSNRDNRHRNNSNHNNGNDRDNRGNRNDRYERENNQNSRNEARNRSSSHDSYEEIHQRNDDRERRDLYVMEKDLFAIYGRDNLSSPSIVIRVKLRARQR